MSGISTVALQNTVAFDLLKRNIENHSKSSDGAKGALTNVFVYRPAHALIAVEAFVQSVALRTISVAVALFVASTVMFHNFKFWKSAKDLTVQCWDKSNGTLVTGGIALGGSLYSPSWAASTIKNAIEHAKKAPGERQAEVKKELTKLFADVTDKLKEATKTKKDLVGGEFVDYIQSEILEPSNEKIDAAAQQFTANVKEDYDLYIQSRGALRHINNETKAAKASINALPFNEAEFNQHTYEISTKKADRDMVAAFKRLAAGADAKVAAIVKAEKEKLKPEDKAGHEALKKTQEELVAKANALKVDMEKAFKKSFDANFFGEKVTKDGKEALVLATYEAAVKAGKNPRNAYGSFQLALQGQATIFRNQIERAFAAPAGNGTVQGGNWKIAQLWARMPSFPSWRWA